VVVVDDRIHCAAVAGDVAVESPRVAGQTYRLVVRARWHAVDSVLAAARQASRDANEVATADKTNDPDETTTAATADKNNDHEVTTAATTATIATTATKLTTTYV
jgi:hypothetical protein